MALKKKERVLSPQELKHKLRTDTASRWLHAEPEFAFAPSPQGPAFMPLSESMEKKLTLLFLLDAGDFLTGRILEAIQLWKERYRQLPWHAIIAFQQKYLFLKDPHFFDPFKTFKGFTSNPIYLDPFGEIFEKFGSSTEPVLAMLDRGELVFSTPLLPDFPNKLLEIETTFHTQLRNRDPGLPLPLLYNYEIPGAVDTKSVRGSDLILEGNWMDAGGAWMTNNPAASVTITFEGRHLRCLAMIHPQAKNPCRVAITLNGHHLHQNIKGGEIRYDEKGTSLIEVGAGTGIYDLIESTDLVKGLVKIQMTNAEENPVIFYEARIA